MLKIGVTGGIGSGKTTVCKIFEILGIPVYYADARAKELVTQSEPLRKKIIELLGEEAYLENGSYNRAYVADIVFKDKKKLEKLNHIIHPAVFSDGEEWHRLQKKVPYTLKEAALLFESGGYQLLDKTILVVAPQEVRIERVIKRDNSSRMAVLDRINKQMTDADKIKLADFVILNDGKAPLVDQILKIHDKLKSEVK